MRSGLALLAVASVLIACGPSTPNHGELPDLSVAAMPCTPDSCKSTPNPVCDNATHQCVDCLMDADCPSGNLCSNKACVPGCSMSHGCPDGGGLCVKGMCSACKSDADCSGATPRCDTNSGLCVECLPTNDNCGDGKYCGIVNGAYKCQTGCGDVSMCPKADGGSGVPACCNHLCVDEGNDNANCGACGNTCGAMKTCCSATCSDLTKDTNNCGQCGNACAGKNAAWSCAASTCNITACAAGFGDCNKSNSDGCEAQLDSDPKNCGKCGMKCMAQNAVAGCNNGVCTVGMCSPGFADCNNNTNDGCEVNINGDPNNCGQCGMVCAFANASAACVNGACVIAACNNGYSNCDNNQANGCEAATAMDPNNCGGCFVNCGALPNAVATCSNSMCVIGSCNNPFKDCDGMQANGCEANVLNGDPNNCGNCGMKCTPGANVAAMGCTNASCTIASCVGGYGNCNNVVADGCEVNLTNDANNCNGCGNVCPQNTPVCMNGVCTVAVMCKNPLGGNLVHDNGAALNEKYCYNANDTLDQRAQKACESHFGMGSCCIIQGGYNSLQWGQCNQGGGQGTIHWHPDSHPLGHCNPVYMPGDVVSPGWCGVVLGSFTN
jgi:hypothetical protein